MDYFEKKGILKKVKRYWQSKKKKREEKIFINCPKCKKLTLKKELEENLYICPECNNYLNMPSIFRLNSIFDSYEIINSDFKNRDPLNFPDYREKLEREREKTGLDEAIIVAKGMIDDFETYVFILDSSFLMGSLSTYVGYRIVDCFNRANRDSLPVISFSASGGARMQEGIFSLMQMANTTFALREHSNNKNLYLSIMTNPTTGGVSASFASLGDIIISEPGAMIGFTGPRVIEQTLNRKLPEDFQRAEFLLEKGFLDDIVERRDLKNYIYKILEYHQG